MNPARLAQRHSRAVILITLLFAVAGAVSSFSLPSSIYPPLQFPRIAVIAHAGTAPGRTMTLTVTRPLEQAIMEVQGIRRVRSRTFRGATEISAQFDPSTDMIVALQQVQNHIAEIRGTLPADTDLTVERLTPAALPMLALNLTGALSPADLYDLGFFVIRPALSRVPGVGRVNVQASDTREIEVVVDPARMMASNLTVGDVAQALKGVNQLTPVGHYPQDGIQHLVLASGLWDSVEQIADTPIAVKGGSTLRVSDVGQVTKGSPDRSSLIVGRGGNITAITISQQIGANILSVRAGIEEALASLKTVLPSGLKLEKTYDLAEFVDVAIANVRDAIIIGSVLAVLVLLVFLRNIRLTIVAACTLPLTVVSTFFFMWLVNESINLMSMGGIAVAIGLVIDDAVVIVENIHRRMAAGSSAEEVDRATGELVAPVVSSTFTTVVVFAPLGLLQGVVGDFFKALSITLSIAVLISLVLALTLIPILARAWYKPRVSPADGHPDEGTGVIDRWYVASLPGMLKRTWLVGVCVAALGGAAVYGFFQIGSGFLPPADEGGFVLDYWTPPGMALEDTDVRMRKVEDILSHTAGVATFVRRTGSEMGMFATQQNRGDILIRLTPRAGRRSADDIIAEVRKKVSDAVPDAEFEFPQLLQDMLGDLEGAPNPIEVKVFGDDQAKLDELSEAIETKLDSEQGGIKGVVDVVGLLKGGPEVTWQVDPLAAGRLGLTVEQVSDQLSDALLGNVATELRLLDRTIPVRVRYPDAYRFSPSRLGSTMVRGANGKLTAASALVSISEEPGQPELMRENLRQMAIISGRLEGRDLGSAIEDVRKMMQSVTLPTGYTFEIGGQYQSQQQAFHEMLLVAGISTALVFVILVIQFRRFTQAALILAAAPLSLGGAFLLLNLTGSELNVSSAMGLILLVGLVVKNGIVLLDFADRRYSEGLPIQEAVLAAARVRLRPILMTTLCTLFGLLPLALGLGAGAELQKPLALAVIGGLSLSTLVTLYLVPAAYVALAGRRRPVEQ